MRTLWMVVVLLIGSGCAARQKLFPASPIFISSPADETRCAERLLSRSRVTGYIEQTVDKEMGFFRVMTKNVVPERPRRGKSRPPSVPRGKFLAVVQFYNVQCTGPDTATITPMNERGALDERFLMDEWQRDELDRYAAALGLVGPSDEP